MAGSEPDEEAAAVQGEEQQLEPSFSHVTMTSITETMLPVGDDDDNTVAAVLVSGDDDDDDDDDDNDNDDDDDDTEKKTPRRDDVDEPEKKKKKKKPTLAKQGILHATLSPFPGRGTVFFDYPAFMADDWARGERKEIVGRRVVRDAETGEEKVFKKKRPTVVRFKICEDTHRYNCVVNALRRAGMVETQEDWDWNLRWGGYMDYEHYSKLEYFQRTNHFPGSSHIGRKDRLVVNMRRMERLYPDVYDFVPKTFILPGERSMCASQAPKGSLWIVKPQDSSCGRGISVTNRIDKIEAKREVVVSRYIKNPFLIDGKKWDLRLYVLVTSYNPLRVYIFEEGLVRFATHKYTTKRSSLKTSFVHLTNYSVNKKSKKYERNADHTAADSGSKWRLTALWAYLDREGVDVAALQARIHRVIMCTLLSIESTVASRIISHRIHSNACFEVFGFDVLVDSKLKPWLLEVNTMPSLSSSSPMDKHIKNRLLTDVFHLIGIRPVDIVKHRRQQQREAKRLGFAKPVRRSSSLSSRITTSAKSAEDAIAAALSGEAPLALADRQRLRDFDDEGRRAGSFTRIYPTLEAIREFDGLFEIQRYNNVLMRRFLELSPDEQHTLLHAKCAEELHQEEVGRAATAMSLGRPDSNGKARKKKKNKRRLPNHMRPRSSAQLQTKTASSSTTAGEQPPQERRRRRTAVSAAVRKGMTSLRKSSSTPMPAPTAHIVMDGRQLKKKTRR